MSAYFEKVKNYLLDLEYRIVTEDSEGELFVIEKEEEGVNNVIIDCGDTLLIVEALLFEISNGSEEMFTSLLKKNRELVHGAFVLDESGKKVLFRDTLELENLDLNELESTLNALRFLLLEYSDELIAFSKA